MIRVEQADGCSTIRLCRPEKANALTEAMLRDIAHAATGAAETARVLILTGEGERSFSAGGDIEAWSSLSPEAFGWHWGLFAVGMVAAAAALCFVLLMPPTAVPAAMSLG